MQNLEHFYHDHITQNRRSAGHTQLLHFVGPRAVGAVHAGLGTGDGFRGVAVRFEHNLEEEVMVAIELKLSQYAPNGALVEALVITAITEDQRDRILEILEEPNNAIEQKTA